MDEKGQQQDPIVWRDSMSDGSIAVRNFHYSLKEMREDELKAWSSDFDKVVEKNLNVFIDYPT